MKKNRSHLSAVITTGAVAALSAGAAVLTSGCSSSSSSAAAALLAGVSDIASLPKATGTVSTSASATFSDLRYDEFVANGQAATSGLKLKEATSSSFTSGKSRAMCEATNLVKQILKDAAQTDKIQCYMASMKSVGLLPSDVDDGNYKYLKLANLNSAIADAPTSFEPRIKTKVTKTSKGGVTKFEMFQCFGSKDQSTEKQDGYNSSDISNLDDIKITAINVGNGSGGSGTMTGTFSYGGSVYVTGKVNSSGAWTSKKITAKHTNSFALTGASTSSNSGYAVIDQYSDRFDVSGFNKGTYMNDTFSAAMVFIIQGLGMDKMTTVAIGDGSAKYSMTFTRPAQGGQSAYNYTSTGTDSWNGDTKAPLSDKTTGTYYAKVNALTTPTTSDQTVSFSTDQTWDCTAPSGSSFTSVDFSSLSTANKATLKTAFEACDTNFGFGQESGDSWIQCQDSKNNGDS